MVDATADWPRYTRRFGEILDDPDIHRAVSGELPGDPDSVIISGSTSGVYEDEKWIDDLVEKTADYIENGVPVLGLCFGHQVIAKAAGAEIEQMSSYEIGYRGVELEDAGIFSGLGSREYPFSSHQDRVVGLPECFEVIGRSERGIQGIRHRDKPVFGVQFHPELTPGIARKAIRKKDFRPEKEKRLLSEVNEANFERARRTLKIFRNFHSVTERAS